jgi:hypothetical protein
MPPTDLGAIKTTTDHEAPDWMLSGFYWTVLIFSVVSIITASGQIYTKSSCSEFKPKRETHVIVFEVFAALTIVVASILFIMSILALVFKMGFGGQLQALGRKARKMMKSSSDKIVDNEQKVRVDRAIDDYTAASAPSGGSSSSSLGGSSYLPSGYEPATGYGASAPPMMVGNEYSGLT